MGNGGLSNGEIIRYIHVVRTESRNRSSGNESVLNIANCRNIYRTHVDDIQICRCRCVREGEAIDNAPDIRSFRRNRQISIRLIDGIYIIVRTSSVKI